MKNIQNLFKFSSLKKTCLNALHIAEGGKMVPFAGYELPVQYKTGIMKQHLHCRQNAALFDVSHMGQITLKGVDSLKLLQKATVGQTNRRKKDQLIQCYLTLFLNENAGIIDDGIVAIVQQNYIRLVVNGANKYIVLNQLQNIQKQNNYSTNIELFEDKGLIALQGPKAVNTLKTIFNNINFENMPFMSQTLAQWNNQQYLISRAGYTGQDGFQISSRNQNVVTITQNILKDKNVILAGLGARDSLRLEAGLCLHGNDMNDKITPLEAVLMWTVFKRTEKDIRQKFIGEDALIQLQSDVKNKKKMIKKRAGFVVEGQGIVRQHCKIYSQDKQIGQSTSGGYGSSLKKSIGMTYVDQKLTKQGTKLQAELRGKRIPISIQKMPFITPGYYKGWNDLQ